MILECLVSCSVQLFGDAEIAGSEPGKAPVATAVVIIRGCILRSVQIVEDAHTYIPDPRTSDLAFFELEGDGLGRGVDAFDDPGTWSIPRIAHGYFDTVVAEFRYLQESPKFQALHLCVPFLVDYAAKASHAGCEPPELGTVVKGHFTFECVRELFVGEFP